MSDEKRECTCQDPSAKDIAAILLLWAIVVPVTVFLATLALHGSHELVDWLKRRSEPKVERIEFPPFDPRDFPLPPVKS